MNGTRAQRAGRSGDGAVVIRRGLEEKGAIECRLGSCTVFGYASGGHGRWGGILGRRKRVSKKGSKRVQGVSRNARPSSDRKEGMYSRSAGEEENLGMVSSKGREHFPSFCHRWEGPPIFSLTSLLPSTPSPFIIKSSSNQIKGLSAVLARRQSLPLPTFFF